MRASSIRATVGASRLLRRGAAVGLSTALVGALALLPTASANASGIRPTPAATPLSGVSAISSGKLGEALDAIPLKELNASQLAEAVAKLPGLTGLESTGKLTGALKSTIETLAGKGDTLGQLGSSTELVSDLTGKLESLLTLQQLLSLLTGGETLGTLLKGALGSVEPNSVVEELLGKAAKPEQLVAQLLGSIGTQKLEALLEKTTLGGEPFDKTTIGQLVTGLETTTPELAKALGTTAAKLPEEAMALTGSLKDGKTLDVLSGVGKLALALVEPLAKGLEGGNGSEGTKGETGSEGSKGGEGGTGKEGSEGTSGSEGSKGASGSEGGNGSNGPSGSNGSNGSDGSDGSNGSGSPSTTVVVNNASPQSTAAVASVAKAISGKVKILSHKVKGRALTVVVQVPGAGTLKLSAGGIRTVRGQTSTPERVTLHTTLTRAAVASLRRHRRRVAVKLTVSFAAVGGSSSTVTTKVTFG